MKQSLTKILIISGVILACAITIVFLQLNKQSKESDAIKFQKEYPNVSKDNMFVYRSASDIIDILEGGTGIVYLGFPECQWCQAYVPMLEEVAKEKGIKKIYYFNILEDRKKDTKEYKKIVELLKEKLDKDEEGKPRVYVPDVTAVKNGKILAHNNETSMMSADATPKKYWTEEKKDDLKATLKDMMDLVNEGICTTCE